MARLWRIEWNPTEGQVEEVVDQSSDLAQLDADCRNLQNQEDDPNVVYAVDYSDE